jgi:PAS domain S-box-containing protein
MEKLTQEAEKTLRLSHFTIEKAPDVVFWVDSDARIHRVNQAIRRYGYSPEDFIGKAFYELFPQMAEKSFRERWKTLRETGFLKMEKLLPAKDGRLVPVEVISNLIEFEGKEYTCSFVRDFSERKEAEKILRESEEKYRNLVEMANDGIIIVQDNVVKYVNPRLRKIIGPVADEIPGIPIVDIIHPDALSQTMERYQRHLEGKDMPSMYESALVHQDGHKVPVEFNIGHLHWQGKPAFIIEIRDFTERKKVEEDLKNALQEVERLKNRLQEENIYLQQEIKLTHNFEEIISRNEKFKKVLGQVEQVASTDATVLVLGETGTGKELIARALHNISARRSRPLVKVNCAALPANLIESELFGHEKGAFTGALSRKIGRFELANGGTIFLDEIGDLPMELQVKLLRVLQDGEFERLGNPNTIRVDVRIIAATNRDLGKAMESGNFREDLYYRLNVFPIYIPPLRERADDISLLVNHFVLKYQKKTGKKIETIPQRVMETLRNYHWPGNVRELENIIERAVILSPGGHLELGDWYLKKDSPADPAEIVTLEEMERNHILKALDLTHWRVSGETGAAKILGINAQTLVSRMKKLEINR